ncbi:MAG: MgtC/SapB family protein, partial [Clostridiales bacterium]
KSPNGSVQGITTAAEILLLAVIGITLGLGLYFPAVIAAIIALVTLMANSISTRIKNKKSAKLAAKSTSDHNTATEDQATPIQKLDNSH